MLNKITIKNFRGFDEHSLELNPLSVIVGENNAGKTTLVEALRLLSIVYQRYKNAIFKRPPSGSNIPIAEIGISPSLKELQIDFTAIFYNYDQPPPGIVTFHFCSGATIIIYILQEEKIHAVLKGMDGKVIKSRPTKHDVGIPSIRILPQISALLKEEKRLSDDYIKSSMYSRLSSLHFRNQLRLFPELHAQLSEMLVATWDGVKIEYFEQGKVGEGTPLALIIRNDDFAAEIGEMGHGLQMWVQIMWFLTLAKSADIVVLDEPDVYMHADLQRKLIRLLKGKYKQTIVATHSVEIMSEVHPEEILILNRKQKESFFAGDLPTVNHVVRSSGSSHNLQLARLVNSNKLIMVEGDDLRILKGFQDILYPDSAFPFLSIPHTSIGGWGGWAEAVGTSKGLKNFIGEPITAYCLFDSDYHTRDKIKKRYQSAKAHNIKIHIWKQKEIENYLINPYVIARILGKGKKTHLLAVRRAIQNIENDLENIVIEGISDEIYMNKKNYTPSACNRLARKFVEGVRSNNGSILPILPGKKVLARLSTWTQNEFSKSLSMGLILKEMRRHEICHEILSVISAIEERKDLPKLSEGFSFSFD